MAVVQRVCVEVSVTVIAYLVYTTAQINEYLLQVSVVKILGKKKAAAKQQNSKTAKQQNRKPVAGEQVGLLGEKREFVCLLG